jgi:hypothetical protein
MCNIEKGEMGKIWREIEGAELEKRRGGEQRVRASEVGE